MQGVKKNSDFHRRAVKEKENKNLTRRGDEEYQKTRGFAPIGNPNETHTTRNLEGKEREKRRWARQSAARTRRREKKGNSEVTSPEWGQAE